MTRVRTWSLVVALLGAACSPEIGDDCVVSTDCSSVGDRLCDTSQPGGYCTIFNCEPGTCPDDSVCVSFHNALSGAFCQADNDRFQRPFCMAPCSGDGDCRGGYGCVEVGREGNSYGAVVIEDGKTTAKVCLANQSVAEPNGESPAICSGEKGGTPPTPLADAGTYVPDASASGGSAGMSAGGSAGTSAGGSAGTSAGGSAGTSAGGSAGTSAGGSAGSAGAAGGAGGASGGAGGASGASAGGSSGGT
ncbi:MAG: hypothetical protein R3B07_17570 [Polyangiaceae bacterium]